MTIATGHDLMTVAAVRIDDAAGAREMTSFLIARGHRRIAFLRSKHFSSIRGPRFEGYRNALSRHGIVFDASLVRDAELTFEGGLSAAGDLLDMSHPPSAIFASNDDMAAGALVAAHTRRLAIPEQVAIAGFDDSFLASRVWPALTSIRLPIADMAELAIEALVERIGSRPPRGMEILGSIFVDYTLVRRGSTGD